MVEAEEHGVPAHACGVVDEAVQLAPGDSCDFLGGALHRKKSVSCDESGNKE